MGSWACSHPLLVRWVKAPLPGLRHCCWVPRDQEKLGGALQPPHSQACPTTPCQALERGMEAPPPASTRASNLGSTARLFVTECTVAHSLQRDMVSLPPRGPTSVGVGGEAVGWGQPQKCAVTRQDPSRSKGGSCLGHGLQGCHCANPAAAEPEPDARCPKKVPGCSQNAGGLKLVPPGMQRDTEHWREACVAGQWEEEMQSSPWMGRASLQTCALVSLLLSSHKVSLWLTMEK